MKRLLLFFVVLFIPVLINGQDVVNENKPDSNKVVFPNDLSVVLAPAVGAATDYWSVLNEGVSPPSPNAASLGIFGNIPIDLYRGTARFDIPLYTLKSAHLELPITLGYAGNGLRVDEIGSNVGLGWSLFTGGIINRTVYQSADESAGYRFESKWLDSSSPFSSSNTYRTALSSYIITTGGSQYHMADQGNRTKNKILTFA